MGLLKTRLKVLRKCQLILWSLVILTLRKVLQMDVIDQAWQSGWDHMKSSLLQEKQF